MGRGILDRGGLGANKNLGSGLVLGTRHNVHVTVGPLAVLCYISAASLMVQGSKPLQWQNKGCANTG